MSAPGVIMTPMSKVPFFVGLSIFVSNADTVTGKIKAKVNIDSEYILLKLMSPSISVLK